MPVITAKILITNEEKAQTYKDQLEDSLNCDVEQIGLIAEVVVDIDLEAKDILF